MFTLYDIPTAQATILRRDLALGIDFPDSLLDGIEARFGERLSPQEAVAKILRTVRDDGDRALAMWSQKLDSTDLDAIPVSKEAILDAYKNTDPDLIAALRFAAGRVRDFHARQPLPNWETDEMGGRVGQRVTPIERVGIYVPGGTAPLPSSLLMSVIPAQVAGVQTIIVCTPPNPHPAILAAAHIVGLDTVYQVGGAQAVAAMAFGTESVPKVDKIVGAGGLFTTLAKQQVYGIVGLDGMKGPTETMVIADDSANPEWVAADLLAQAEHDPLASAILLTPSRELAEKVAVEVARQTELLSRAEIIVQSLKQRSGAVIVPDLKTAVILNNTYAPEHLCVATENARELSETVTNAGGIFIGERSFEVLGDYVAGPSHVMPTGATARFESPLNVNDFVKIVSIIELDDETSRKLSPIAAAIARVEGLTAHAASAALRSDAE